MSSFDGSSSSSAKGPSASDDGKDQSPNQRFERPAYLPPLSVVTENLTPFAGHEYSIPRPIAPMRYPPPVRMESWAGMPNVRLPPPHDRRELPPAVPQQFVVRRETPLSQPIPQRAHFGGDPQFAMSTTQNMSPWSYPNQRTGSGPSISGFEIPASNPSIQSMNYTDESRPTEYRPAPNMPLPYDRARYMNPVRDASDSRAPQYMRMPAPNVVRTESIHLRPYQPPISSGSTSTSPTWNMPQSPPFPGHPHLAPRMPHHSDERAQNMMAAHSGMQKPPAWLYPQYGHWAPTEAQGPHGSTAPALRQQHHRSHDPSAAGREHSDSGGRATFPTFPHSDARGSAQLHGWQEQNVVQDNSQAYVWQESDVVRGSVEALARQRQNAARVRDRPGAHEWQTYDDYGQGNAKRLNLDTSAHQASGPSVPQGAPPQHGMGSVGQAQTPADSSRHQQGFQRDHQPRPSQQNP